MVLLNTAIADKVRSYSRLCDESGEALISGYRPAHHNRILNPMLDV